MTKIYCDRCGIEITKGYRWLTDSKTDIEEENSLLSAECICPSCFDWILSLKLEDYDNYQRAFNMKSMKLNEPKCCGSCFF